MVISNVILLWSEEEMSSVTDQFSIHCDAIELHSVKSKTSCLDLVTNVGSLPELRIWRFVLAIYAKRVSPRGLISVLPHTKW